MKNPIGLPRNILNEGRLSLPFRFRAGRVFGAAAKAKLFLQEHFIRPTNASPVWMVISLGLIALFYPGIMTNDSLASLEQARTYNFTNWHPPIMAIIWSGLLRAIPGSLGMLVAQAILYSFAMCKFAAVAFPSLRKYAAKWVISACFTLFPPAMALTGFIWKDTWTSALLVLAAAYMIQLARERKNAKYHYAIILICCATAIAFRHNAVAAAPGLLAGAAFVSVDRLRPIPRLLIASAAGLVVSAVLFVAVSAVYRQISVQSHPVTPTLIFDIAGTIVHADNEEEATAYALEHSPFVKARPSTFVSRIEDSYDPRTANPVIRTDDSSPFVNPPGGQEDLPYKDIANMWWSLVTNYPSAYLRHRAAVFSCLIQLCSDRSWIFHSYVLNEDYMFPSRDGKHSLQHKIRQVLFNPSTYLLYAPWIWLLVCIVGGGIALFKLETTLSIVLFISLSAIGMGASLFFAAPIEAYRYAHWIVIGGWMIFLLFIEFGVGRSHVRSVGSRNSSGSDRVLAG